MGKFAIFVELLPELDQDRTLWPHEQENTKAILIKDFTFIFKIDFNRIQYSSSIFQCIDEPFGGVHRL